MALKQQQLRDAIYCPIAILAAEAKKDKNFCAAL
jgi:hypothetical protein